MVFSTFRELCKKKLWTQFRYPANFRLTQPRFTVIGFQHVLIRSLLEALLKSNRLLVENTQPGTDISGVKFWNWKVENELFKPGIHQTFRMAHRLPD